MTAPNQSLTDLTATTTPALTDLLYTVVDPSGSPLDHKVTNQSQANLYRSDNPSFVATADATVANTGSETSIIGTGSGSLTLAAAFFTVGKTIRVTAYGFISNTGTPTLEIKVKLGSTIIAATGAVTTASGLTTALLSVDLLLTCRTTGASGTVIASGIVNIGAVSAGLYPVSGAAVTVDTTATQAVGLTATWGAADPANTLSIVNVVVSKQN